LDVSPRQKVPEIITDFENVVILIDEPPKTSSVNKCLSLYDFGFLSHDISPKNEIQFYTELF
jgi:hypothetical protein